jgi:hypothetical protein
MNTLTNSPGVSEIIDADRKEQAHIREVLDMARRLRAAGVLDGNDTNEGIEYEIPTCNNAG